MRGWSAFLLMFSLSIAAPAVRAEPSVPPANTGVSEPEPSVWYGWQVMISDGIAAATLAFAGDDEEWLTASLAIYGLGGPLVHTGNLQGWRALGSLGLRTAGTALAAATFMDVGCGEVRHENEPPTYDCTGATATALMIFGAVAAVDAGLLANRAPHPPPRPDSEPAVPDRRSPDYMLLPRVELRRGGAQVGAVLVF